MKSVGINSYKKYVDQVLDDLSERQRNNSKIIAFQTEYRDTDDNSEYSRHNDPNQKRQEKPQRRHCDHISHTL